MDQLLDAHVHLERGPYTPEWVGKFVETARSRDVGELWLLEHCYRFAEFLPMYEGVRAKSDYIDKWLGRKGGKLRLSDYLGAVSELRGVDWPVKLRFGLEICYFPEAGRFTADALKDSGLDFLVGSVHFVDGFAFDHKAEFWDGVDVDECFRRYFETSISLAESGSFDGIAHPDSIKLYGHRPSFSLERYYERLAEALDFAGMYAEQNTGVYRRTGARIGMERGLLDALKRRGVRIVTASDAHCPEDVGAFIREAADLI